MILLNTDIPHDGYEPSTVFARAVTSIATPEHGYELPAQS